MDRSLSAEDHFKPSSRSRGRRTTSSATSRQHAGIYPDAMPLTIVPEIAKIYPRVTTEMAMVFWTVAKAPPGGISLTEVAERHKIPLTTARHFLEFMADGYAHPWYKTGMGLLEKQATGRPKPFHLTDKGRSLVRRALA